MCYLGFISGRRCNLGQELLTLLHPRIRVSAGNHDPVNSERLFSVDSEGPRSPTSLPLATDIVVRVHGLNSGRVPVSQELGWRCGVRCTTSKLPFSHFRPFASIQ